jgi:hypothetical protein
MYQDIEILGDRFEEEQEILNEIFKELVEDGEEFLFNPNSKNK